jgi:hypothetical protein
VAFGGRGTGGLEVDAGVVDDSVHPADLVHLIGELRGLGCAGEVADDDSRGVRGEVAEHSRPLASAGVEDNVRAFSHERRRRGLSPRATGQGDHTPDTPDGANAAGLGFRIARRIRQAPEGGSRGAAVNAAPAAHRAGQARAAEAPGAASAAQGRLPSSCRAFIERSANPKPTCGCPGHPRACPATNSR